MRRRTRKQRQRGRGLTFANGGGCMSESCALDLQGGSNCRVGVLNPRFGGKAKRRHTKRKQRK